MPSTSIAVSVMPQCGICVSVSPVFSNATDTSAAGATHWLKKFSHVETAALRQVECSVA